MVLRGVINRDRGMYYMDIYIYIYTDVIGSVFP